MHENLYVFIGYRGQMVSGLLIWIHFQWFELQNQARKQYLYRHVTEFHYRDGFDFNRLSKPSTFRKFIGDFNAYCRGYIYIWNIRRFLRVYGKYIACVLSCSEILKRSYKTNTKYLFSIHCSFLSNKVRR